MSRLSIEITGQQHQQIKAMAALKGISIKEYILQASLPNGVDGEPPYTEDEKAALVELTEFLKPRIESALRGEVSYEPIEEIIAEARRKYKAH